MPGMRRRIIGLALLAITSLCMLAGLIYSLPPVHERLSWRIHNLRVQAWRAIFPPEAVVFVPQAEIDAIVQATLQALTPSPTVTPSPTHTPPPTVTPTNPPPTDTPTPTPTFTPTPTPIPPAVTLTGIRHEYQQFNNCGPANLAMALSYWGWQGNQTVTREYLRPSYRIDDKNVNPFEMVDFVGSQTDLKALWRVGGDLELLKGLVAGGFPVIIEQGIHRPNEPWTGHYRVINGYDDSTSRFIIHDSLLGPAHGYPLPYAEIYELWRHFNYVYVVIYPADRESEVLSILGPQADPEANYQHSAEKARRETESFSGVDLFYAWYNLGMSLVYMEDYPAAAEAFDTAFAVYGGLPAKERPWRMFWYQVGPYPAYFHTGRYQDVLDLAYTTLVNVDKPVLEETYYWRGMVKEAQGDLQGAIEDFQRAYRLNPRSTPAGEELLRLGVALP
jgi:hypothetical protein